MTTQANEDLVFFAYCVIAFTAGCVLGDILFWVLA